MQHKNSIAFILILTLTSCSFLSESYRHNIDGVYIPRNLNDAILLLDAELSDSIRTIIKNMSEDDFLVDSHFGIGASIRNRWGLWKNSRLSRYFKKQGIRHPDDMSSIILTSYYRYLTKQEVRLKDQIAFYKDYWDGVEDTVLPEEKMHPEPNLEFGLAKLYGHYTENKKWARVYIQTNSRTDMHWIYDYYYGWKQISTVNKNRLVGEPIEDTESLMNEIFK